MCKMRIFSPILLVSSAYMAAIDAMKSQHLMIPYEPISFISPILTISVEINFRRAVLQYRTFIHEAALTFHGSEK